MNLIERIEAAPGAAFDYAQMDDGTAADAKAAADRYRRRSESYVMDTGRDLLAIKERLDHGLFLKWVEAEMGLTPRTAQNFMQAAAQLGTKSEIVSHLPPTTLYKLASPIIPEPVRAEIVERLEAGEALSPRQINDRLWEATEQAKREAAEAKLTPEERKLQAKRKRDTEARRQRELEKWRNEQAEKRERETEAVKQAAEILAGRLDDESFGAVDRLLAEANPWDIRKALQVAYRGTEDQSETRRQIEESTALP